MTSKVEAQIRSRSEFSTLVNQFSDFVKDHKGKPKRNEIIDFLSTELFKKQSHHHLLSPLPEHDFPFLERFSQERRYACELNFFICDTCKRPCSYQAGMVLWNHLKKDNVGTEVKLVHNGFHCDPDLSAKSLPVSYLTTEMGGKERLMDLVLRAELGRDPLYDEATRIDWAVVYGRLNVEGFEELHSMEGGESAIRSYMEYNISVPSLHDLRILHEDLGRSGDLIPLGAQRADFFGSVLVRVSSTESEGAMRSLSQLGSLTPFLPILDAKIFSSDNLVRSNAFKKSLNSEILSEPWAAIDLRNVKLDADVLDALEVCLWTRERHLYSTAVLLSTEHEIDLRRFKDLNLNHISTALFKDLVASLNTSQ